MAIVLAEKYMPYVDEIFTKESKRSLITNQDFTWTGVHTIKVYKVSTSKMNDYKRNPTAGFTGSRYGEVHDLDATTEEFTLRKDRSFTYAIDKLDKDETMQQVEAASSLSRQQREVIIPEVDAYVYAALCENAGHKPAAAALTAANIYAEILKASEALDNAEVPETNRFIIVTPSVYALMKKSKDITMETDIGNDLRLKGVISNLDGAMVIKVPAIRLPEGFGFLMCHPCATVAPVKLEDYIIHECPPGINGALVEGRICYDAFVLENKAKAIYYQAQPVTAAASPEEDEEKTK